MTISASQPATAPPAYHSLDSSGAWAVTKSPVSLNVNAADAVIGPIVNPFTMPPTPATIASTAESSRTVLFHRL